MMRHSKDRKEKGICFLKNVYRKLTAFYVNNKVQNGTLSVLWIVFLSSGSGRYISLQLGWNSAPYFIAVRSSVNLKTLASWLSPV